ncbi:hypothetical protein [Sulfitobacter aestuariivivens]|uniref:hypothetical protein n=1 Tax=Sulfitobacter aestuariivivens TaxID=2766981 RepID=UPI0036217D90
MRKGALPDLSGNTNNPNFDDCVASGNNTAVLGDDHVWDIDAGRFNDNETDDFSYGFPDNLAMSAPNEGLPGGAIGANDQWDIYTYFEKNYWTAGSIPRPGTTEYDNVSPGQPHPKNVLSSNTGRLPSRYDVYLAELENGWYNIGRAEGDPSVAGMTGEIGSPACGASMNPQRTPDTSPTADDRRLIVGALIDCKSQSGEGGGINNYVVNSYVAMFLTRPVYSYAPSVDPTIDIEIVDVTGSGSNGTLDTFIRNESILVR